MEKVNEVIKENNKHDSNFFSYVFNFDEDNKAGMLNMMQYTLLAILPVVILLKLVKHYIPEDDESKPSLEVLVEVILQLVILFLSIWFIDKMISQADVLSMPQNVNTGNTSLISDLPVAPPNQQANNQVPQMDLGPMAANEALGGGFGSMW